ncbi:signal peptidase I [Clavibacter michiganensis]|uniref:Signal peptidase I n=1 Tax=Clavibacter michiganensis TaxID=28447 RepID=A0A2S5VLZ2_9MICO|nr:signal peptidase I [Clavibacter michiganensis]PPF63898.1 signal peptidase I [Clavibacter michiganensis]
MTDQPATADLDTGDARRRRGWKSFLRDVIVIVIVALLASVLIKTFLVRSFFIPSGSMENTLQIDDRILVNELVPDLVPLRHGDVVVFHDPGNWLTPAPTTTNPLSWLLTATGLAPTDDGDHLIKRVIGLPGDTVACCNEVGQLTVNDTPIVEPYTYLAPGAPASDLPFTVTVPDDSLWVMGDNRGNSADSRAHTSTPSRGFVPYSDVVGRAILITWPLDRWTWIDDHSREFEGSDGT